MKNLSVLLKTSRPVCWVIAPLIFLRGWSASGAGLTWPIMLQALMLSFPYCVLLYGINDIYDYRSDNINPRKKLIEGIVLKPKNRRFVKNVAMFAGFLLAVSALPAFNIANFTGMVLLLFFSYYYSAPPLRLKERPPLDSFSNGVGYYFAPFLMGFGAFNVPLKVYLIALFVMALHAFTTISDYTADKKSGQKTFAIVFGKKTASAFLMAASIIVLMFAGPSIITSIFMLSCALFALVTILFPSEKLALLFFRLIFVGFILTTLNFII